MLRAHAAVVCLLAALSSFGQAPKPAYADPSAPPFIVRLQRRQADRSVCAIVRGDGLFHLESERPSHFVVAEGALSDAELAELKTALANPELAALTQAKIMPPHEPYEPDEFSLNILRPPVTQALLFRDRESRRSFDTLVNPLLHWLEALQRHPQRALDEFHARNNCLPPKKVELSRRNEEPAQATKVDDPSRANRGGPKAGESAANGRAGSDPFIMRWSFSHVSRREIEDTCIIVYRSGLYHMEKAAAENAHDQPRAHAFESALGRTDLKELKTLLNEPNLKATKHYTSAQGRKLLEYGLLEGDFIALEVAREDGVQQLKFADYILDPDEPSVTDAESKLVNPLRRWLQAHVKPSRETALPKAVWTDCAPKK